MFATLTAPPTPNTTTAPTATPLTSTHVRKLIETINHMAEPDHEQVFRILHEHGCRYTQNANGVFVNMAHVPYDCMQKVQQFVQYWTDQNRHIEQSELARVEWQQVMQEDGGASAGTGGVGVSHRATVEHRAGTGSLAETSEGTTTTTTHTTPYSAPSSAPSSATVSPSTTLFGDATDLYQQHQDIEPSLSEADQQLVHTSITHKRRQLNLNKKGKTLLKRGGAVSRVARKCIASEEDRVLVDAGRVGGGGKEEDGV